MAVSGLINIKSALHLKLGHIEASLLIVMLGKGNQCVSYSGASLRRIGSNNIELALAVRNGFFMLPLFSQKHREIVQSHGHMGMIPAEHLLEKLYFLTAGLFGTSQIAFRVLSAHEGLEDKNLQAVGNIFPVQNFITLCHGLINETFLHELVERSHGSFDVHEENLHLLRL